MSRARYVHSFCTAASLIVILFVLNGCGGSNAPVPSVPPSGGTHSGGSTTSPPSESSATPIVVTAADRNAAASAAPTMRYHLYPVRAERTSRGKTRANINYPADLQFFGGAVIASAVSHDIYVNCTYACWGDPQGFLDQLDQSTFMHVVDQYVGASSNNRYQTGPNVAVTQTIYDNVVSVGDMLAWLHRAASLFGNGYGQVYHIFLPADVDTCFDLTTTCYSPDNPSTFAFCAYHGSAQFPDNVGHVIFTVEPYQYVPGCEEDNSPNGSLVDSTASTLSHELIEAITDPDPGSGWYNLPFNDEIADECAFYVDNDRLNKKVYEIQEEYSNAAHACVN